MSSDVSIRELISRANRLLTSGDLVAARQIAHQAYLLDQNNPDVLVLVSKVIADPAKQRVALQSAVQLDPNHREARQRLTALDAPTSTTRPPLKARTFPVLPILAGMFGVVLLLVLVGVVVNRSRPDGAATEPTAAVALPSTVAAAPILMASTPTNNRLSVSPTALPTATLVPSVIPPTANTAGLDPLVLTATALQQGIAATGTRLAQAVVNTTQVAGLTQTATQQGALGATVAAQQTALAAMDSLPGRLIVLGTRPENVTSAKIQFLALPQKNVRLTLSPDAQHIAYPSDDGQTLYIANADGANPQPVDLVGAKSFDWSPNGQRLLVGASQGLSMVSLSDRVPTLLFASGFWQTDAAPYSIGMVWSPDNQHIAWVGGGSDTVMELSVLDTLKPAEPVHARLPTTPDIRYSQPVWFADGKRLMLRVGDKDRRFLVIDALSGLQKASLPILPFSFLKPFWLSPTGQWVILQISGDPKSGLYMMKTDGSALKFLIANRGGAEPVVGWSPDGQRAFIGSGPLSYDNLSSDIQWLDTTDLSLHSALKGQQVLLGWYWSPDSQSMFVCQVTQNERRTPTAGKLWLVPVVTGNSPMVLLNTPVCPDYWLP